ncbi:MAG: patatin-like phospholipase family protein [Saprospiraceae bacterium]|nr:patatin-like phospholipase family protein [Saprospiraceae bacterium]
MYADKVKVGITLSGGGARGFAHIGVLKALEEAGVQPDVICGTSAGALIGVLYAQGYAPEEIQKIAMTSNIYKVFRLVLPRRGLSNQDYIAKQLQEHVPQNSFSALTRKFYVGVTNLNAGKHEIWEDGPLHDLVIASSAVPGIFQPVEINGCYYVDGGVMNNMPADVIRNQCDFLIASNVVTKMEKSTNQLNGLKSILARTFEISLWYRSRLNYEYCDLIIEPDGLHDYHIFNFGKAKEIAELGYQAGKDRIARMKNELQGLSKHM